MFLQFQRGLARGAVNNQGPWGGGHQGGHQEVPAVPVNNPDWVGLWLKVFTRIGPRVFRLFIKPGTTLREAAGLVLPEYISENGFYVRLPEIESSWSSHQGLLQPLPQA